MEWLDPISLHDRLTLWGLRINISNMGKRIKKLRTKIYKPIRSDVYARIDWDKASKLFQQPVLPSSVKHTYPRVSDLLKVLAAAGAIGMVFAFPGAASAISSLVLGKNSYGRWQTKQVIGQMAKRKLVQIEYNNDGSVAVKITKNGMKRALTYQLETMKLKKPKFWDRKWRLVIFDVPELYRKARDLFRMRLKQLGLHFFQESVYVSPYPCFSEVEFLRELYGIPVKVRYLLVEKIEDDEELKDYFELG